jgi:hypothetical protein
MCWDMSDNGDRYQDGVDKCQDDDDMCRSSVGP